MPLKNGPCEICRKLQVIHPKGCGGKKGGGGSSGGEDPTYSKAGDFDDVEENTSGIIQTLDENGNSIEISDDLNAEQNYLNSLLQKFVIELSKDALIIQLNSGLSELDNEVLNKFIQFVKSEGVDFMRKHNYSDNDIQKAIVHEPQNGKLTIKIPNAEPQEKFVKDLMVKLPSLLVMATEDVIMTKLASPSSPFKTFSDVIKEGPKPKVGQ